MSLINNFNNLTLELCRELYQVGWYLEINDGEVVDIKQKEGGMDCD